LNAGLTGTGEWRCMGKKKTPVRTLTFLRHAKSSWKEAALADLDRPLNKRGRRDAVAMASRIAAGSSLATIFASPSLRTRETVFRLLEQLPAQDRQLVFDHALYTFDSTALINALQTLDDNLLDAAIVGHNPALQETIGWLRGSSIAAFPTAACAKLTIPLAHWCDLAQGCATLDWLLVPEKKL